MKPCVPLIIDANALCHKAKHTMGELTNDTMRIGVIFGLFNQLLKLAKTYESNRFAFTWDSTKSLRLKVFPEYKEGRRTTKSEKTPEEKEFDAACYDQFDQLRTDILPALGFKNNFMVDGYEGDDLIASIVYNSCEPMHIVSGDEDMYQCLHPEVSIINSKGLFTYEQFKKMYGIEPGHWIDVKAIGGCKSDEVPGIKGIGEAKAIQYILGTLPMTGKSYSSIVCQQGKELTKMYRKVVELPFAGCPELSLVDDDLNFDAFLDMCNRLNFLHFLKKEQLTLWKQYIFMKNKLASIF